MLGRNFFFCCNFICVTQEIRNGLQIFLLKIHSVKRGRAGFCWKSHRAILQSTGLQSPESLILNSDLSFIQLLYFLQVIILKVMSFCCLYIQKTIVVTIKILGCNFAADAVVTCSNPYSTQISLRINHASSCQCLHLFA